ncbi:hypothetical protein FH972_001688 [Carpinus fangiana]|uniref:Uncharacterized protein n=1 Tax=Carpinus fangiana TaxID=176857 RepID=A0A5N6QCV3_9ROSI|nr:hypothetical protein FH972_001688 [Carpinus fangiana]
MQTWWRMREKEKHERKHTGSWRRSWRLRVGDDSDEDGNELVKGVSLLGEACVYKNNAKSQYFIDIRRERALGEIWEI